MTEVESSTAKALGENSDIAALLTNDKDKDVTIKSVPSSPKSVVNDDDAAVAVAAAADNNDVADDSKKIENVEFSSKDKDIDISTNCTNIITTDTSETVIAAAAVELLKDETTNNEIIEENGKKSQANDEVTEEILSDDDDDDVVEGEKQEQSATINENNHHHAATDTTLEVVNKMVEDSANNIEEEKVKEDDVTAANDDCVDSCNTTIKDKELVEENVAQENGFSAEVTEDINASTNSSVVVLVADDSDVEMNEVPNNKDKKKLNNSMHEEDNEFDEDDADAETDVNDESVPSKDVIAIAAANKTDNKVVEANVKAAENDVHDDDNNNNNNNDDDDVDDDDDDGEEEVVAVEENLLNKSVTNISSDSDGAVIINSDSESETTATPKPVSISTPKGATLPLIKQQEEDRLRATIAANHIKMEQMRQQLLAKEKNDKNKQQMEQHIIDDDDDDDDDCVVIEDDGTPAPAAATATNTTTITTINLSNKRKNTDNSLNDVSITKRQRSNASSPSIRPLSLSDARNLINQHQVSLTAATTSNNNLAAHQQQQQHINNNAATITAVPKLVATNTATTTTTSHIVAVAAAALTAAANAAASITAAFNANNNNNNNNNVPTLLGSLPGLTTNSTLLPGLTDDMYVLEAPSFIVPYIYEKPPAQTLKTVCKEIEQKFKLSKEDLAEADKSDEFDMMTEQNKEDKSNNGNNDNNSAINAAAAAAGEDKSLPDKKKKRNRGADDPDESWSEGFDEDDDDDEDEDDSDTGVRTKVLIKEAADDLTAFKGAIKPASAVVQSSSTTDNNNALAIRGGQENYFESPLGKFFMDIGIGLVQEHVQSDLIRLQKRKMRKSLSKNLYEYERAIAALNSNLEASKKKNDSFKFPMKRCEFCSFKSESALSMANHYETPHMNGIMYKCNFCSYEIRNATEIVYHMEAMHNIKARLIKPLPYHQCSNCGFEDNGKAKLARHQPVCAKKFRPEINLCPPADWEAPAKIPRIKPRHGLVGTATAYQAMAAQAAAQKMALATIQEAKNLQATNAAQNANKVRGRPPSVSIISKTNNNNNNTMITPNILRGSTPQLRVPANTNLVLPNNYHLAGAQLLQQSSANSKKPISGQPSISITPLPRQNVNAQNNASGLNNNNNNNNNGKSATTKATAASAQGAINAANVKAQYVICEICDGYIKDLDQLRNHMQWMHKVRIHPKMIYNRPPLNCQKCQFRFFTDQGLERHLLGSHGLVTSSMQEAANKAKDAGRCPVCGRMYQWNLLNHVSREHHMTLKPAHLSYKCTVCTATFGMYKQFETHVYTAHSTVAKKAMDTKKNNAAAAAAASTSTTAAAASTAANKANNNLAITPTGSRTLSATNDALLKPLKINDEITIIPQPATKPRIVESHVID